MKISTVGTQQTMNISRQKLTIGLDLGDRNSWYCVLDEAGQIQVEQRVRTTAGCPTHSRFANEWISWGGECQHPPSRLMPQSPSARPTHRKVRDVWGTRQSGDTPTVLVNECN